MKKPAGIVMLALVFLLFGCGLISRVARMERSTPAPAVIITEEPTASMDTAEETISNTGAAVSPEPTQAPKPAASQVSVAYNEGTVTVTGLDASGAELWKRGITIETETELMPYSEAVIDGGAAYLQVDYRMTALNAATGETLWTSELDGGFCTPVVAGGMVYTCSYYGSPLDIFSAADGKLLFEAKSFDDSFFWPYKIELVNGSLTVYFDQAGGEDTKGTATFGLEGNFIEKKIE